MILEIWEFCSPTSTTKKPESGTQDPQVVRTAAPPGGASTTQSTDLSTPAAVTIPTSPAAGDNQGIASATGGNAEEVHGEEDDRQRVGTGTNSQTAVAGAADEFPTAAAAAATSGSIGGNAKTTADAGRESGGADLKVDIYADLSDDEDGTDSGVHVSIDQGAGIRPGTETASFYEPEYGGSPDLSESGKETPGGEDVV